MSILQITNQKPVELSPNYTANIMGTFNPIPYVTETMAKPLMTPLMANTPVSITDKGVDIKEDQITDYVLRCTSDVIDVDAEDWCKDLYSQTLVNFPANTHLSIREIFPMQAASKENLPLPTPTLIYTPASDVIPIARKFMAGQVSADYFFASLAFYARPKILGFYFVNETAFDDFKAWLAAQVQNMQQALPADTNQLFTDFETNVHLNSLTEALALRQDDNHNNDEMSFARMIVAFLMQYTSQVSSSEFGVLPFDLSELYCPLNIIFVNIEKHGHATASQVADEWNIINQAVMNKVHMISNNKLSKLTAAAKAAKKAAGQAANALANQNAIANRMARTKFKKTRPNMLDITNCIKHVIDKMKTKRKTMNVYRASKSTFAKANRRDPDDFNKKGIITSTKYRPDIHVYIDTSGSISEEDYQHAIKALIRMARKMNVNFYFNSFSHIMSQCTKLSVKDKSISQIYAKFQRVPKVSGGTDYEQIWNYINKSKKRQEELSLIITDFEWTAPSYVVRHPENLYYLPCATTNWASITSWAQRFVKSCEHNDPAIRAHLLF